MTLYGFGFAIVGRYLRLNRRTGISQALIGDIIYGIIGTLVLDCLNIVSFQVNCKEYLEVHVTSTLAAAVCQHRPPSGVVCVGTTVL